MTFGVKAPGCCLACGRECYRVHESWPADHPVWPNKPRILGSMLDHGTQVEFLLSDGTEADVTFCVDCAGQLAASDYHPLWSAVIEVTDRLLKFHSSNDRRRGLSRMQRQWPLAVLRWRRESPVTGAMVVDRRGPRR